ncbi:hypothetical protein ACHQM5_009856 [Ranunculus cassubicifolius]
MNMAVRAASTSSILRSPPIPSFKCCINHFGIQKLRRNSRIAFQISVLRYRELLYGSHGGLRNYSVHNLVVSVMEELEEIRARKKSRATVRMGLVSTGDIVLDRLEKRVLHKGLLLEFRKDAERVLLAVAQRPDGKKNWIVIDQNGVMSAIKPQQITYIISGVENFEHTEILDFVQKADEIMDPTLLEFAWAELLEKNQSVTPEELAELFLVAKMQWKATVHICCYQKILFTSV